MPLLRFSLLLPLLVLVNNSQGQNESLLRVSPSGPCTQVGVTLQPLASVSISLRNGSAYYGSDAWTHGPRETLRRFSVSFGNEALDTTILKTNKGRTTIRMGLDYVTDVVGFVQIERSLERRKHAYALYAGYGQAIINNNPNGFLERHLQFGSSYIVGKVHGFETGIGLYLADGWYWTLSRASGPHLPRTLFASLLPVGYRYTPRDQHFTFRVGAQVVWNVHEFNSDWSNRLIEKWGRTDQWESGFIIGLGFGWAISRRQE